MGKVRQEQTKWSEIGPKRQLVHRTLPSSLPETVVNMGSYSNEGILVFWQVP